MDEPQRKLIERVRAAGRLVVWPDDGQLAGLVPEPVLVEGSDRVGVVLRAVPGEPEAPGVIHLLNRHYDGDRDGMIPQKDFSVRLRRDLFGGGDFAKAIFHTLNAEARPVKLTSDDAYHTIEVPELDLWAIVELSE
jgi:hypothetical protein